MVCLKQYLSATVYHSLELQGRSLSVKVSRDIPYTVNNSVRWLMTAVTVVEDIWNRKGYF